MYLKYLTLNVCRIHESISMNKQLMFLLVLERAGHAKEIAQTMVLEDYYGIVIVSGDGLVYEV